MFCLSEWWNKMQSECLWQADLVISLILQEICDHFSKIIYLLGFDNSLQTLKVEHELWGFCDYGLNCESQKSTFVVDLQHATHTVVFANLLINGRNEGVHGFVCQLRDAQGYTCPGIRIADNGQKVGVNGVDNGRIW